MIKTTLTLTLALACALSTSCTITVKGSGTSVDWGELPFVDVDEDEDECCEPEADCVIHSSERFDGAPSRVLTQAVSWEHGETSRWAAGEGFVRFAADDRSIVELGSNAAVWIGEESDGVMREVRFVDSAYGQPRVIFEVQRTERDWDAAAREWFADLLPEVATHAVVGAPERAQRIHRERGSAGLVDSFSDLQTGAVRAIYLERIVELDDIDVGELADAIAAGDGRLAREGAQYSTYRSLADRFGDSAAMRNALLGSVDGELSAADRFDVQRALLSAWRANDWWDEDLERTWIAGCELPEESRQADLLLELVVEAPRGDASRIAVLGAARELSSSVLRTDVIERCIDVSNGSEASMLAVVEELRTLDSELRREALLMKLLRADRLTPPVLDAIGDAAAGLESPAAERRVLERLSVVRSAT